MVPVTVVRFGTSYITVACMSDKRWFDLDAVRLPYKEPERIGTALGHTKTPAGNVQQSGRGGGPEVKSDWINTPGRIIEDRGGAPPLDWWDDAWDVVRSRLIDMMCPARVCVTCGKPSERITGDAEYQNGSGIGGDGRHGDPGRFGTKTSPTLGWSDCGHNNWRPGVAFDPFTEDGDPMSTRLLVGDVRARITEIPDGSVDLVVTSPPFLALRKYGDNDAEMGSEGTPADFLDALLDLTQEFRRVLAPHGSIAIELGDTYSGSGESGWERDTGEYRRENRSRVSTEGALENVRSKGGGWPLSKSLALIPQLYPASLAYGRNLLNPAHTFERWRVRNIITWCRPNPPVGALGDKVRPATSYITVACPSAKRWFDLDAVRTTSTEPDRPRRGAKEIANPNRGTCDEGTGDNPAGAPPLDWWDDALDLDDPTDHTTIVMPTQPYPGAHYACVDDQTEALTLDGWKRHGDLRDGEQIAAYDRTTGTIRWETATFHRYPYEGELVVIDKRETSQRLTPNHRVLYRTREGVEHVARADEVLPSHQVPVAAPFAIGGRGMGEDWAALLGWYITEGSAGARSARLYQSETANPKHCNRIRDLLRSTKAEYVERQRVRPMGASFSQRESVEVSWTIKGLVGAWLLATAPAKRLTAEVVFGWSEPECVALLDALIDGDGHTRTSGRRQFIQKDTATVDMVQALCCRLGYRSTLSRRPTGTWALTIGERKWLSLRTTDGAHVPLGRERYEGVVWCPSVPSTFWLARRNGRPFITGNTWPAKLAQRLIDMMCPARVCVTCGKPSERIVGDAEYPRTDSDKVPARLAMSEGHRIAEGVNQHHVTNGANTSVTRQALTIGWSDCGHGNYRAGHVLDPFAGSGTTLAVGMGMGRDVTGIELYPVNAQLISDRVGMFLEVVD